MHNYRALHHQTRGEYHSGFLEVLVAKVSRNLRKRLDSAGVQHELDPRHVALFNRTRIRDALTAHKQRMGWHNLVIRPETVEQLLETGGWYELHAPPERMQVRTFEDIRALEGVAVERVTEYAAAFWKQCRRRWERGRIEVVRLDENDDNNIGEYRLSIDAAETRLIQDVRDLVETLREGCEARRRHK